MRKYTVKKHYLNAAKALATFAQRIKCADAEALVSNHPCRIDLMHCRDLGEVLGKMVADMRYDMDEDEMKRKVSRAQSKHTTKVLDALATGKPVPPPSQKYIRERLKADKAADDKQWNDLAKNG